MSTTLQRLLSEALGTLVLVFFGATAAVSAGSGAYGTAVAYALALTLAIWLVGGTSGAHLNPAVTIVMAARKRFAWRDAPGYIVAQLGGGILGSLLLWAVIGSKGAGLGATAVSSGTSLGQGLLAEGLAGFLIGATYYAFYVQGRLPSGLAGLSVGLAYGTGTLALASFTGASANFARSLAPQVGLSLSGGTADWSDLWVYAVGPVLGVLVGALVVDMLLKSNAEKG